MDLGGARKNGVGNKYDKKYIVQDSQRIIKIVFLKNVASFSASLPKVNSPILLPRS